MIVTPADSRNLDKVLKLIGKAPEEIKLDLDWANIKDEPRSAARRRRGRGGGARRPPAASRDRDRRPRPVPVHGEVASIDALRSATADAVRADAPRPRPRAPSAQRGRRGGREPRPARRARPRPRPPPRARRGAARRAGAERRRRGPSATADPAPRQAERPDRADDRPAAGARPPDAVAADRDDGDDGVVGFGRDVPAFLARPPAAPLRRLRRRTAIGRSTPRLNPAFGASGLDFRPEIGRSRRSGGLPGSGSDHVRRRRNRAARPQAYDLARKALEVMEANQVWPTR